MSNYKYTIEDIERAKNFFSKYENESFRPYQAEAIQFIMNSEKPVVALHMPTGAGKSLIGACIIRLYGDGIYLAHSKALQDQIITDHPEFKILKGRNNYQCPVYPKLNCDECPHRNPKQCEHSVRGKCENANHNEKQRRAGKVVRCNGDSFDCEHYSARCKFACPYIVEREKVRIHPLRILNYPYWILSCNYGGGFTGKSVVVCDEADKLDDIMLSFISLSISDRDVKDYNLPNPHSLYKTACENGIKSWKIWASKSMKIMIKIIENMPENTPPKDYELANGFKNKIGKFLKLVDDTWRLSIGRNRYGEYWMFKPVWITPEMTDTYFRDHIGQKMVLMSATLKPPLALSKEIGIPVSEMDYMEVPSTFDPKNSPIYLETVTSMSKKAREDKSEMQKFVKKIKEIIDNHPNEKGLIHTKNYEITKFIMDNCNGCGRLITHRTKDRSIILKEFIESNKPLVLVSPSMERGISLNGDRVRFIIIGKAPYPDLSDQQISSRLYSGNMGRYWYQATTCSTIEQSIGRGVRSDTDWCKVYIVDRDVENLIANHREMFSKHFLKCLVW